MTTKENPSDYPNETWWAFPKFELETQEMDSFDPVKGKVFNPETGRWRKPKKGEYAIVVKVTYLEELPDDAEGNWGGYLWKVEATDDLPKPIWLELFEMKARQSEAFGAAAGFVGAAMQYTDSGWFSIGT